MSGFRYFLRGLPVFCRFQTLPASCKSTLPEEFYAAFVTKPIFFMLPIVLIVVVVLSTLIDQ